MPATTEAYIYIYTSRFKSLTKTLIEEHEELGKIFTVLCGCVGTPSLTSPHNMCIYLAGPGAASHERDWRLLQDNLSQTF